MDGIGSRTGRQSSRYGSAPVFTGPVRRWQKQWVHVSSSASYNNNNNNNNTNRSNSKGNNNISTVRIRRWTPVPSAGDSESVAGERPRRKLRYAPIVVLESKKKEAEKSDVDVKETNKINPFAAQGTSGDDDNVRKVSGDGLAGKAQAASKDLNNRPMDLDTRDDDGDGDGDGDGDDDEDHDLGGADKDKAADWVNAAQKGFAC